MAGLEQRLAAPGAAPLSRDSTAELARLVEALSRRLARAEADSAQRLAEFAERLAESEQRTEARLHAVRQDLDAVWAATTAPAREPRLLRAALWLASGAAALSVAGAGALVVVKPEILPPMLAAPLQALRPLPLRPSLAMPPLQSETRAPNSQAMPADATRDRYADVAAALERGEALAVARLTGLAQAGDAAAQLHLARLHETGAPGVPRDLAAARAWTKAAAEAGDRTAMHNLALFLAEGEGGPRDAAQAARWFRQAATAGVVDSQYNLGLLYEAGRGVERNLAEAYRWFTVAANAGDLAAREAAVTLGPKLKPAERAGLERDAAAFRPGKLQTDTALIVPPAETLAETQALLARAGYYIGPTDGTPSAALQSAAAAYLRDHPRPGD